MTTRHSEVLVSVFVRRFRTVALSFRRPARLMRSRVDPELPAVFRLAEQDRVAAALTVVGLDPRWARANRPGRMRRVVLAGLRVHPGR